MRYTPWVLDGGGCPLAPSSVIEELKQINPRLGLNYHKGMHAFMLTLDWPEDDPRHELIRRGDIAAGSNFEILMPVPTDVSLDELRNWLASGLRRVGESREDIRRMVEAEEKRLKKQNDAVLEQKLEAAREELIASAEEKTINVGKRRTRVK